MPQLEIQTRNLALKHAGLVVIAIGIAVLHYLTPTVWHHFHIMYLRMFYLPIILASF